MGLRGDLDTSGVVDYVLSDISGEGGQGSHNWKTEFAK